MKHLPWAGLVLAVAFGVGGWFGVPRIKRHQCVEQLVAYRQSAGTTPPGLQPMILFEAKHACLVAHSGRAYFADAVAATRGGRLLRGIPTHLRGQLEEGRTPPVWVGLVDLDRDDGIDVWSLSAAPLPLPDGGTAPANVPFHHVDDLAD